MRPLLLLLIALGACAAAEAGPLTDAGNWTITGAATFTPEEIREALLGDVPVLATLRAHAERQELFNAIEQRTALGYACAGFAACRVRAKADGEHLAITIAEGPRDRCGTVVVEGAKALPAADLSAALTGGWLGANGFRVPAAWPSGKPVNHDPAALPSLVEQMRKYYFERLQTSALIDATVVAGATGSDLHLTVRSEGQVMRVGRIRINGCQRFDEAAVRALVPLHTGDALPVGAESLVCGALRDCGRFRTQRAVFTLNADQTVADLDITIGEGLTTPGLDVPLTPVQAAAVRATQWLTDHASHGPEAMELSLITTSLNVTAVFANGAGWLLTATTADGAGAGAGGTLLARGAQQWLVTDRSGGRLCLPPLAWSLELNIGGSSEPPEHLPGGQPHEMTLGCVLYYDTAMAGASPMRMNVSVSPFFAFNALSRPGAEATVDGGVLTIRNGSTVLTADADSGRLHAVEAVSADGHVHLRLRPVANDLLAAEAARLATVPALPADGHPLSTAAHLLIGEACAFALRQMPDATAERDLVVLGSGLAPWLCLRCLAPLEQRKQRRDLAQGAGFTIPQAAPAGSDQITQCFDWLCRMLLPSVAETWPADSWPVSLPRNLLLLSHGQSATAFADLGGLAQADATGPLGCLGAAMVMIWQRQSGALPSAEHGLAQLADAGLAKESALLASATLDLDALPTDPPWLGDLTPGLRVAVSSMLAAAHGSGSEAERVHAMGLLLWHGGLRELVAVQLKAIAHLEPP